MSVGLVALVIAGCAGSGDFMDVPGIGSTRIDVPRPSGAASAACDDDPLPPGTDATIAQRVMELREIGLSADQPHPTLRWRRNWKPRSETSGAPWISGKRGTAPCSTSWSPSRTRPASGGAISKRTSRRERGLCPDLGRMGRDLRRGVRADRHHGVVGWRRGSRDRGVHPRWVEAIRRPRLPGGLDRPGHPRRINALIAEFRSPLRAVQGVRPDGVRDGTHRRRAPRAGRPRGGAS